MLMLTVLSTREYDIQPHFHKIHQLFFILVKFPNNYELHTPVF